MTQDIYYNQYQTDIYYDGGELVTEEDARRITEELSDYVRKHIERVFEEAEKSISKRPKMGLLLKQDKTYDNERFTL